MAAQLSLTKVRSRRGLRSCRARAIEFLARARLAADEDGGVGGGDGLDLLQHPAQGGALADDLAEVVLGADLLLQVGLLLGELVLERLDLLEGQGVLDGHGHLVGDLLQEVHVRRVVGGRLLGREHQRAQPPPGRGQRQPAVALDPVRLHPFQQPRPAAQLGHARGDERLLGLPHQPRRVVFDGKNDHGAGRDGFGGLQDVQAHGVGRRLVQDQGEVIEAHHLMEPAGQLVEQRGQIAVRDDRFRDRQQGPVLLAGGKLLAVSFEVSHSSRHSEPPRAAKDRETQPRREEPQPSGLADGVLILRVVRRAPPEARVSGHRDGRGTGHGMARSHAVMLCRPGRFSSGLPQCAGTGGQVDDELGACAGAIATGRDAAPVQLDQGLHQGQSESGPRALLSRRAGLCQNRSNTRGSRSGAIPQPLSRTRTTACPRDWFGGRGGGGVFLGVIAEAALKPRGRVRRLARTVLEFSSASVWREPRSQGDDDVMSILNATGRKGDLDGFLGAGAGRRAGTSMMTRAGPVGAIGL